MSIVINGQTNDITVGGVGVTLDSESNLKADKDSPALTGTPTSTTPAVGDNSTKIATTAFVNAEIANDAPSKTGSGASGSWGISVTGSSSSCTGNAATATNVAWSGVTSKPTTVAGYGITDALPLSGGNLTGLVATVGNTATFNSASDTTLSVRSSGAATPAVMSFHRPSAYAINFGLDTDNVLKAGGWSAGSSYPIMLDTAHSFSGNGYQRFSNGLIIQWGTRPTGTGNVSVTFPIAFPNDCVSVVVSGNYNGSTYTDTVTSKSTTSFSGWAQYTSSYYIAIGY